ncbi:MAG: hypothetical protein AAFM91_07415 [Pseudomonadota bacterium]
MSGRRFFVVVLCVFATGDVFACSIGGSWKFEPTLEDWEREPGPKSFSKDAEGPYWIPVPAPIVTVTNIVRGTAPPGATCMDAGILFIDVALPDASPYEIGEFGVYFRVADRTQSVQIFSDVPLHGDVQDGAMKIVIPWLDGHPRQQSDLNLDVEAFLVTNALNIGPATKFSVVSRVKRR